MPKSNTYRWSKFFWSDWSSEPALRLCSLAARGLWMELLCMAFEGTPRGHVTINRRAATVRQIARIAGVTERECKGHLQELEEAGVFSRTPNGVIYCRRMVRDAEMAETGREYGLRGGNPALLKGRDGAVAPRARPITGGVNPALKADADPEAELETETEPEAKTTYPDGYMSPPFGGDASARDFPREEARLPAITRKPIGEAVEVWNTICGSDLGKVKTITPRRRKHLSALLEQHFAPNFLEGWQSYCRRILKSDFLSGRRPDAKWRCSFDFALNPEKCIKIIEGRYRQPRACPAALCRWSPHCPGHHLRPYHGLPAQ